MSHSSDPDARSAVVVPLRPGPVLRLHDGERRRGRDEIDDLLDDVFGQPDDRGPGLVDGVLVLGGVAAIIVGIAASLPGVVVAAGIAALLIGAVLPIRSAWRRVGAARRGRRLRTMAGDGMLLRVSHPGVAQLVENHERVHTASTSLAPEPRAQVEHVAHAALVEVASLLDGRQPCTAAELEYVAARTDALDRLASTVTDPRVGDGEHDRRLAQVEARREIEQLTGSSSLTDAAELSRRLLGDDGA